MFMISTNSQSSVERDTGSLSLYSVGARRFDFACTFSGGF